MIVRFEPWGAWARLEDAASPAALVAIDRVRARGLGLDGRDIWTDGPSATGPSAPLEVHLSVTARCGHGCEGCYLDARPDGFEPSFAVLEARLAGLAASGVFTVAFGGGEPTLRDDLGDLARAARRHGLVPVLTTSGIGLSDKKRARLADFAQINVSYDGPSAAYASVRGFDGASAAEESIRALASDGRRVGVNVVLTRTSFESIFETAQRARALGASEMQLLRYKPAGRAASLDYLTKRLSREQIAKCPDVLRALCRRHEGALGVRIDCAMVPFLSTMPGIDGAMLRRLGIFGCEAGQALAAARADGKVSPCSFAGATELDVERLPNGHRDDPTLNEWRSASRAPAEPCASCPIALACKGGCKVVARHVDGVHGPDPECPRVVAYRNEAPAS